MVPEKSFESQAKMQAVSVLFDQWRSTRKKKGRVPENLWQAAVELSPSYSTYEISKALRLGFKELKRRIGDGASRAVSSEFVELKAERLFSAGQCVMEVRSPAGFELKIQTDVTLPSQCMQLLSCFLDHGR